MDTQIWQPDTCGCVLEQASEGEREGRSVSLIRIIHVCEIHAGLPTEEVYMEVQSENVMKNNAVRIAARELGVLGRDVPWQFDEGRKPMIRVPAGRAEAVLEQLNSELGEGKAGVIIRE